MRRRFIADEVSGKLAYLTGQNAAHLARVLRAQVGQEYEISANGIVHVARITNVSDARVEFALGEEVKAPALVPITLMIAIFKFDRLEWAVEKATELGVSSIVPVIARRTEAHLAQSAVKRVDRWRRIAHEASQQSRRVAPPEIADPQRLKDAISLPAELCVLCAESEQERSLREVITGNPGSLAIAVGPEGGWTEDEVQLFTEHGWVSASLGPTILRAETAVIAALAVANSFLMP